MFDPVKDQSVPQKPKISVVVPVYRQWHQVPELLQALREQTLLQENFEVVLVANEVVPDEFDPALLAQNTCLEVCLTVGSYAARNQGVAKAQAAYIVFTDADCVPDPHWLATYLDAAKRDPDQLWAGVVAMSPANKPTLWSSYDEVRGIPQERYVRAGYGACANLGVPRSALQATGGFNNERLSGGDAELCRKAGALGYPIGLLKGAVVTHPARQGFNAVSQKARRIRGGQVCSGPLKRRVLWCVASFVPPFKETLRFARADVPLGKRVAAIYVLYLVWGIALLETLRLLLGTQPERQ